MDVELEILQAHLLQGCLCLLADNKWQTLFRWFQSTDVLLGEQTENWDRDRMLILTSSIQLICDILKKQYSHGRVCPRLIEIRCVLARKGNGLAEFLMDLAEYPDPLLLFAASRALISFFLIMDVHIDQRWITRLIENIEDRSQPYKMTFSLDILRRIIEWKDTDEHTLDDGSEEAAYVPLVCQNMQAVKSEEFHCTEVKCICIRTLGPKWPEIASKFDLLIRTDSARYETSILQFLNLWKVVVSIKACIPVIETEIFYVNLNSYVALLTSSTSPIIWKHLLNLFNEILCYGNALALQEDLDDKPCELAHKIVRSVKDRQLLNMVPYRESHGSFSGCASTDGSDEGDKVLLRKIVLLILKAVAITVKETRNDSSSDSNAGSEVEDAETDMAVIERSIRDVIKKLDTFIKALVNFHPEARLAQWVVQVFTDQDDILIESMICCLDVAVGLCYRENAHPDLRRDLNPSVTLLQFLQTVAFDTHVLYDFLISNETNFLLYFYRVLKYLRRNLEELLLTCSKRQLRELNDLMNGLRTRLERAVSKNSFPYNINPVLKLLRQCEDCLTLTL